MNKKELVSTAPDFPREVIDILSNKNIWDRIVLEELEKKIVGEKKAREIIFMCAMGKLVGNSTPTSFNLLMHSDSSAGKDYTTKCVLSILPTSTVYTRTRISPTVLNYWKPYEKSGLGSWDGSILYLPDIGESILNSDALKLMCSDGSHITVTEKGEAKDIEILGKPVMFITTANSTPNEEMLNRFSIVHLDESPEQTRNIFNIQAERAMNGGSNSYDPKMIEALSYLKRVNVKIPFAMSIARVFPHDKLRERRNFERFLDFIKAIAAFHQYQRISDGSCLLAEIEDYDKARGIFMNIQCGVSSLPLNRKQKEIMEVMKKIEEPLALSEVHSKLGTYIALNNLRPHMDSLVNLRIIDIQHAKDNFNREIIKYTLSEEYTNFKPIILPHGYELLKKMEVKS